MKYKLFLILSFCGVLYFIFWLIRIVTPVILVEANYQLKKIMIDNFKTNNLVNLVVPNLKIKIENNYGSHKQAGIVIPAIFVDEKIIYNVDPNKESIYKKELLNGIAHASGTSMPGSGGVGYYFAHSSPAEFVKQYNAVFYLLGKLKNDDVIYIWHDNTSFEYIVNKIEIREGSDVSFLKNKDTFESVILATCWPPGTTLRRLLVYAKLK